MKTILFIDTSDNKLIKVGLEIDGKKQELQHTVDTRKAQVTLPLIEKILKENGITLKDLTEIQVNPGPGSFTGLRVGASIANTLGFLLNIPVNGKELVEPQY